MSEAVQPGWNEMLEIEPCSRRGPDGELAEAGEGAHDGC